MLESKRKEGETSNSLYFRFSKRVRQSGIMKEVRKRRFHTRPVNRRKVRLSARHKEEKRVEVEQQKKLGVL